MEIGGHRPTKSVGGCLSVRPYEKQDGSLQNKEAATHYYLEAVRQPMEEPPEGPKRNGYVPRKNPGTSGRS
jgi:hypothetical protein